MLDTLLFIGGFILVIALIYWYIEIYTVKKHWREATAEAEALMRAHYGPNWRTRRRRPGDQGEQR